MAWAVDHKTKVIFIHVPKTGGRSLFHRIEGAFSHLGITKHYHEPLVRIRDMLGSEFDEYFTLGMVREPYDRMASIYIRDKKTRNLDMDLHEWLVTMSGQEIPPPGAYPQSHWLCDENDNLIADYVGRYEEYQSFVQVLSHRLRVANPKVLPFVGQTVWRKPWSEYFTQDAVDFMNKHHSLDFHLFGYKKCNCLKAA